MFQSWFGEVEDYEFIDAAVARSAAGSTWPGGSECDPRRSGSVRRARHREQAYIDSASGISALDLLCSGFHVEPGPHERD